jgi:anti-sigma regulatory factor (Ser/Thr protein kinase)
VPWNKRTLAIPAIPPSVRLARRWVSDVLEEVGRADLVDSASLGVSELVTNALLHADPPVTIRVRGTVNHPRVEVTDQSLTPPRRMPAEDPEEYIPTFGRGLDLVASHALKWGSDVNFHGTGKTVWFEPAPDPHPGEEVPAIVFTPEDVLGQEGQVPEERITVRFLGMPPGLFLHLRNHFYELARELRLLDLAEPGQHPLASELVEVFLRVESERRRAVGTDRIDEALQLGVDTVDLEYQVPFSAPDTMKRAGELLERLYETDNSNMLLTAKPPEEVIALQRWYVDQFVRQGQGDPPTAWEGPTKLGPIRRT